MLLVPGLFTTVSAGDFPFYFILLYYSCRFSLPLSVFVCWLRMLAALFSAFPLFLFDFGFCLFVSAGAPLLFPLIYFRFQVISASTQHFMVVFAWFFCCFCFSHFFGRFSCCISSKTLSANICHLRVCVGFPLDAGVSGVFLVVSLCTFARLLILICGA